MRNASSTPPSWRACSRTVASKRPFHSLMLTSQLWRKSWFSQHICETTTQKEQLRSSSHSRQMTCRSTSVSGITIISLKMWTKLYSLICLLPPTTSISSPCWSSAPPNSPRLSRARPPKRSANSSKWRTTSHPRKKHASKKRISLLQSTSEMCCC